MKKNKTLILLAILIAGIFPIAIPTLSLNDSTNMLLDDLDISQTIKNPAIAAKITQEDPRGYLTGRIFYNGFDDIEPDGYSDTLMVDIEVNITSVPTSDFVVMAELYDWTFQERHFDPYNDEQEFYSGYFLWGNSSFQNLGLGPHNMTVHFNCTQLRALKLAGPYAISHVKLANGSRSEFHVFHEEQADNPYWDPLLLIPQIFDIYTYEEPLETGGFVVHSATLTEYLEVNVTFQSFSHWYGQNEPYYIRLVLRNGVGGPTIGHWEQAYWLPSDTANEVRLTIPRGILGAFDFGGTTTPTISFEDIAIVELFDRDAFDSCNMSYSVTPHSATIDISTLPQIRILASGDSHDFGDLAITDSGIFGIISENSGDVLHLEVDRREPECCQPDFNVWYLDGFGRSRGTQHKEIVGWEEWMGNVDTNHYQTYVGKYPGLWLFEVVHPDHDQPPETTQGLTVRVDITQDISPPSVSFSTPSDGANFLQYYGIPIQGTGIDESIILQYQILSDQEVLYTYKPFEEYWGPPPIEDDFSFVWFPSHEDTGEIMMTIRAIDMTFKSSETRITITINAGTIPSPESTINKGLAWLRTQQNTDGSWEYEPDSEWGRPGMAALAALCFIQAGLAHESAAVEAIDYLINRFEFDQDDGRSIYHSTYETSMATTTLIAYNATLPSYNSELDSLIEDAIAWLVVTQNDETWEVDPSDPWYGGWRYGDDHQSSDLSVSQWAILALSTYENFNPGGLDAYDPSLWSKVDTFVRRCRGGYTNDVTQEWVYDGGFTYTPSTEDWRDMGSGSYGSMTAAGIWGLYLSGSEPEDPDIVSALNWINNSGQIVGENPRYGRSFEYYWYLSASKAFLMAGRETDQWWYDKITEYLNTHMIYASPTSAYWDNTAGGEPPVFATVQAILAQQVFYGHIPMHSLEVTLESADGSAIYLWNSSIGVGYNYTTGIEEFSSGTSYSGLLPDLQQVSIHSPTKGEYQIQVFPAAGTDGISSPQDMVLRARALTESGHILRYRTYVIDYDDPSSYPQVLQYRMVLTTISGLDIHLLPDGYKPFTHTVSFNDVDAPTYVELNEDIDITLTLTNIGVGTIPTGTVFTIAEDLSDTSEDYTNWAENTDKIFTFTYDTSGLSAGIRTIVVGLIGEDTTPLLIRIKVQIGNRAPEGELDELDSVLSGTETISWSATDPDGDDLSFDVILVKPDGSEVTLESDSDKFRYYFDTTAYPDDSGYRIIVIISDGTDTTELRSSLFEIMNAEETSETGEAPDIGGIPGFEFFFALLALSFILMYLRRRN
ncbi:MAG: hypothetical protein JSW11_19585 [Candidatus Heimdallarchaeota archaeon]|nr:MAG: hypothetical protein JSW11_19585 [Candidatus Heimdallarchaeota archaeon]